MPAAVQNGSRLATRTFCSLLPHARGRIAAAIQNLSEVSWAASTLYCYPTNSRERPSFPFARPHSKVAYIKLTRGLQSSFAHPKSSRVTLFQVLFYRFEKRGNERQSLLLRQLEPLAIHHDLAA